MTFFSAAAIAAAAGMFQGAAAVKIETAADATWVEDDYEVTNLAQVGAEAEAEAEFFKKFVHFSKDAIKTIAPALST